MPPKKKAGPSSKRSSPSRSSRLECSICCHDFSPSNRKTRPLVGVCGHSVCATCAKNMTSCPFCRRAAPKNPNYRLIDALEELQELKKEHKKTLTTIGFKLTKLMKELGHNSSSSDEEGATENADDNTTPGEGVNNDTGYQSSRPTLPSNPGRSRPPHRLVTFQGESRVGFSGRPRHTRPATYRPSSPFDSGPLPASPSITGRSRSPYRVAHAIPQSRAPPHRIPAPPMVQPQLLLTSDFILQRSSSTIVQPRLEQAIALPTHTRPTSSRRPFVRPPPLTLPPHQDQSSSRSKTPPPRPHWRTGYSPSSSDSDSPPRQTRRLSRLRSPHRSPVS